MAFGVPHDVFEVSENLKHVFYLGRLGGKNPNDVCRPLVSVDIDGERKAIKLECLILRDKPTQWRNVVMSESLFCADCLQLKHERVVGGGWLVFWFDRLFNRHDECSTVFVAHQPRPDSDDEVFGWLDNPPTLQTDHWWFTLTLTVGHLNPPKRVISFQFKSAKHHVVSCRRGSTERSVDKPRRSISDGLKPFEINQCAISGVKLLVHDLGLIDDNKVSQDHGQAGVRGRGDRCGHLLTGVIA